MSKKAGKGKVESIDPAEIQQRWQSEAVKYAQDINVFVAKGLKEGWDQAGDEPKAPEAQANWAQAALQAVMEANQSGQTESLKEQWPPSHDLLMPLLESKGQSIPCLFALDDGSFVARIGASYQAGHVVHVKGDKAQVVSDVKFIGRSPDRRYFAMSSDAGVRITQGWMGEQTALCSWPTGLEGVPDGFNVKPLEQAPSPSQLIVFPDGQRVLLVSEAGIWVLTTRGATRLLPTTKSMQKHFKWLQKEHPGDEADPSISMEHGAMSADGQWIAVGGQDTLHLVFDAQLKLVSEIGHASEYPHFAHFSSDSSMVIFNSCHFYNGETIGVQTSDLPGLKTKPYDEHEKTPVVQSGARVYAAAHRNTPAGGQFMVGDASGYVHAFDHQGRSLWQHFLGSSFSALELSADGNTLYAATYAGYVSIIALDAGRKQPYQIGTADHLELRRWLFWREQPQPLIW